MSKRTEAIDHIVKVLEEHHPLTADDLHTLYWDVMVQRYDICYPIDGGGYSLPVETHSIEADAVKDGEWVTFKDHEQALATERAKVTACEYEIANGHKAQFELMDRVNGLVAALAAEQGERLRLDGEYLAALAREDELRADLAVERERADTLETRIIALESVPPPVTQQTIDRLDRSLADERQAHDVTDRLLDNAETRADTASAEVERLAAALANLQGEKNKTDNRKDTK